MKVVIVRFGAPKGGMKSEVLWGHSFSVMSRKIARKVFSSVWLALD